MPKMSTRIVDRGFTFRTDIFRYEKVWNFGRSAVARNAFFPAVVMRMHIMRSCFNTMFSFRPNV